MDLTSTFSQLLASHNSRPLQSHPFDVNSINAFLQEAYSINTRIIELTKYLRSIRAPYLALETHRPNAASRFASRRDGQRNGTTSEKDGNLTDGDRKAIEEDTKQLLTTLSRSIKDLAQNAHASTELSSLTRQAKRSKRNFGALGRWAAGGGEIAKTQEEVEQEAKEETARVHHEAVIWYLQMQLQRVSGMQRDMVTVRLQRTIEKDKSSMYKAGFDSDSFGLGPAPVQKARLHHSKGANGSATGGDLVMLDFDQKDGDGSAFQSSLSPEQIQMFEAEQEDMVKHYNSELQKIRYRIVNSH
jgi:syntaxin 18